MKEQLESLNSVTINFGEGGMMLVNIILAFVMFGVALGIKPRTIKDIIKKPKSIITGILLQWVALPAITFAVAITLSPLGTAGLPSHFEYGRMSCLEAEKPLTIAIEPILIFW